MNDEATNSAAGGDRTGPAGDHTPKPPRWDGPALPPPPDQAPPWEAQPLSSDAPSPWGPSRPNSVPPSPWGTPQPDSGPPASTWQTSADGADATWPLQISTPAQPSATGRRVEPSAPRERGGNRLLGWVAGIVAAALVAGAAGFFIGAAGDEEPPAQQRDTGGTTTAAALFETLQMAQNKAKIDRELTGLAEPWLTSPGLDNCVSDVDKGAPPLSGDESRRVTCRYGAAWVHFVVYKGPEQKEAARAYRQQLNFTSDAINPGIQDPSRATGGVSKANGKLIEYAFRQQDGRAMCGMFWEREEDPQAALMIEALCEENLGGEWEPLRDLLRRHS